jgi:hypothetical protein
MSMSLHVLYKGDRLAGINPEGISPFVDGGLRKFAGIDYDSVKDQWAWKSFDEVSEVAAKLTAITGVMILPVDQGSGVSPRYRVIRAPVLGDAVSKSFNGDTYPCGYIARITKTWQITTDTGQKFRRYKNTAGWREAGRGFWMVGGHLYEQNPSF